MRISALFSAYLTGSLHPPAIKKTTGESYSDEELDDFEMSRKDFDDHIGNCYGFKNDSLNLEANLNTTCGQFRFAGQNTLNSLFSGIGAGFGEKTNFTTGLGLAGASLIASSIKEVPILSTKFSIFSLGGNLVRAPLHILDSVFSAIGEHGSKYNLPSILAGGASLFGLGRILSNSDNKSFELPNDTISGVLGRTAIHHIDSMLASKGSEIASNNEALGSFLASSATTLGFLLPDKLKKKQIPWNTLEGFISLGGSHFINSLFSSIGNSISSNINSTKKLLLGTVGFALGTPLLGSLINSINHKIPFGTLEGKLIQSVLNVPEAVAFNLGDALGNSSVGIPMTLGLTGLTYLTCFNKNILKNFNVPRGKIGSELQRIPFMHLMYSTVSASGMRIANSIPNFLAPIIALIGPALSFQIGERFKNVSANYYETNGLMVRNTVHLWESILSNAAYKTGRMMTGTFGKSGLSGSLFGDRWLTSNGRLVPSMAIGKQKHNENKSSLLKIALGALGGLIFGFGTYTLGKYLLKGKENEPLDNEVSSAIAQEVQINRNYDTKPIQISTAA